jgi:hypothetical protein
VINIAHDAAQGALERSPGLRTKSEHD